MNLAGWLVGWLETIEALQEATRVKRVRRSLSGSLELLGSNFTSNFNIAAVVVVDMRQCEKKN